VWSIEEGRSWVAQGARIVTYKTDTTALRDVFGEASRAIAGGAAR
jgi:hypothetical protein